MSESRERKTCTWKEMAAKSLIAEIMQINEAIAKWRFNASPNDDLTLVALQCESAFNLK